MLKKILLFLFLMIFSLPCVYSQERINILYDGSPLQSEQEPLIKNGRTLVPVRTVCEALGLGVSWDGANNAIKISDEFNLVIIVIGYNYISVNDNMVAIDAPAEIVNGYTLIPIRAVIEPFGASLSWDESSSTINIYSKNAEFSVSDVEKESVNEPENIVAIEAQEITTPEPVDSATKDTPLHAFYSQPDERWGFEASGRGFCWVCSYAMIITNLTGEEVTPLQIAEYNISNGGESGSYMTSHFGLASAYSLRFAPALSEASPYFDRFETERRGATYIKAETEDDVRMALKEALTLHPKGVMVRFEGYPHTIVATNEKDMVIYFNDPANQTLENVPFIDTCLAKSFTLKDISFIQALTLN